MKMTRFSKKAAIIAAAALALLGVLGVAIWVYPPLLLYGMLAGTGLLAYVAVYFIVLSQLRREAPAKVREERGARDRGLAEQDLTS